MVCQNQRVNIQTCLIHVLSIEIGDGEQEREWEKDIERNLFNYIMPMIDMYT